MAILAEANGVPASAVIEEDQAHDTIQNIYYSDKIMAANGWHTTEVISSPYHLPRTALILRHYAQLRWKTQASSWPPELWRLEETQTRLERGSQLLPYPHPRLPAIKVSAGVGPGRNELGCRGDTAKGCSSLLVDKLDGYAYVVRCSPPRNVPEVL